MIIDDKPSKARGVEGGGGGGLNFKGKMCKSRRWKLAKQY